MEWTELLAAWGPFALLIAVFLVMLRLRMREARRWQADTTGTMTEGNALLRRQVEFVERQVAALERIAAALEKR